MAKWPTLLYFLMFVTIALNFSFEPFKMVAKQGSIWILSSSGASKISDTDARRTDQQALSALVSRILLKYEASLT